jgi:hypothetical protein
MLPSATPVLQAVPPQAFAKGLNRDDVDALGCTHIEGMTTDEGRANAGS